MNSVIKTKIIIISVMLIIVLLLVIVYNKNESNYESKSTKTEKIVSDKISATNVKADFSIKPKNYKYTTNKTLKSKDSLIIKTDTIYSAFADTSLFIYDTLGKIKGIINLNTEYKSDFKLSENAKFYYKVNSLIFSDEKYLKESELLTTNKVTEVESKIGLGLFAGGILTHDKKLTYGVGIGIFYKIIY